eukprot:Sdes_comp10982_c0_seq1m2618
MLSSFNRSVFHSNNFVAGRRLFSGLVKISASPVRLNAAKNPGKYFWQSAFSGKVSTTTKSIFRAYSSASSAQGAAKSKLSTLVPLGIFGGVIGGTFLYYGGPENEDQGTEFEDYSRRFKKQFKGIWNYFADPNKEKLLPDQLPRDSPYYYEYTLCLEFDKVLAYSEWDVKHGWRTVIRPGAAYFLFYLAQFYEIVLFTSKGNTVTEQILNTLDPEGAIRYRLYRGSTRYMDGIHVKDLSCLNRDLKKTLIIDHDPKAFGLQPHNGVLVKPYQGEKDDRELLELLNFLETIVRTGVEDVTDVMKAYEGKEVGKTFNALLKQKVEEAQRKIEEKKKKSVWGFLSKA